MLQPICFKFLLNSDTLAYLIFSRLMNSGNFKFLISSMPSPLPSRWIILRLFESLDCVFVDGIREESYVASESRTEADRWSEFLETFFLVCRLFLELVLASISNSFSKSEPELVSSESTVYFLAFSSFEISFYIEIIDCKCVIWYCLYFRFIAFDACTFNHNMYLQEVN